MTDIIKAATSDSTNDGSGASTTLEPPQLDNVTDDAIIIQVTQSLNNAGNVASINVTTPSGYTLLRDLRDVEVRSWVFYKRSTGSETIPTVTSDTSAKWSCSTAIVSDVDWLSGGVVQQVGNTGNGDMQSSSLTTNASGSASVLVCFYALERRTCLGFRYPNTRASTVFLGTSTTGSSEGVDNASGIGYDFLEARSTSWTGPFWETNGSGDSLAINVEVLTQGNIKPLQSATYVNQSAPANTFQTNMNWCREIINSGKDLDNNTLNTWTFDASTDVLIGTNEITLTGHGMDESMVLYFSDNGNTAPSGLANDTFYYAFPQTANTIKLCTVNEDTDSASDFYYNSTTQRPIVGIAATGSGAMTFTEARMINAGQSVLDIFRPNIGNSSNIGPAPGNYVGDAGYNQNFVGTAQRFNSVFDATDQTITFELQVNSSGRLDRVLFNLIDEDGDWINWLLYKKPISVNSTGQLIYQFQVDKSSVKALKYQEHGTFDHTRIRYLVITLRGNNASSNRFGAVNSSSSVVNLGGPFTVVGGSNTTLDQFVTLAESFTTSISKPSDLQVVSTIPLSFGDGITDVSFLDSEKSIAFPPLADGVNTFQNYLDSLGISIKATSSSSISLQNSQIGASVPFTFDVTAAAGATVDLTGNSYVFATANLDSDVTYNRQLFVGGKGVNHNNSEIRNSTFIVNSQLGADKGIVEFDSNTDIEDSAFELSSGTTTGHGIEIIATGSFDFNNLTFNNFGADGTSTAAVYNNSGGAVTIIVNGGNNPTVRNGVGSSTTLSLPLRNISITGITAGSRLRIYNETTASEVHNGIVSGTSYTASYQEGVGYSSGDVISFRLTQQSGTSAKLPFSGQAIASSIGWTALVNQDDDTVYNTNAIDGSTITKFTADYVNNEMDLVTATDFTGAELYARFVNLTTTADGIRNFFKGFIAKDIANYENDVTILDLFLNNNTISNVKQTDNVRIYKSNGTYPVRNPTTGGGGIDVVWRNKIFIAETGVSGLTPDEAADLAEILKNSKLIPASV